jgi:hypothetical protein
MAKGLAALKSGDGAKLVEALRAARDPVRMLATLGHAADTRRWDVHTGACVLLAADYLLAQPVEQVDRFLPTLAIAATRALSDADAAKRHRAHEVLAKLRALLARSEFAADMVARSGCYALGYSWIDRPPRPVDAAARAQSKALFELVRDCALLERNESYRFLAIQHG